jgi:ribosomal protein S18 acetylase RimI-like enzyme
MLSRDRSDPRSSFSPDATTVLRKPTVSSTDDTAFVRSVAHDAFLAYGSYDQYLGDWLENDAVSTYIAEVGGKRAGFYMVTTYRDAEGTGIMVADLIAIAVAAAFRSRGVGKRLLAHACSLVSRADPPAREMWIVVAEGNARARRFFARHGFRLKDGVGVYPAGQRALRMVRPMEVES